MNVQIALQISNSEGFPKLICELAICAADITK